MANEFPSTTTPTQLTREHLDNKSVLSEYKDVFEGKGLFTCECNIYIDENAIPVVNITSLLPYENR